VTPLEPIPETVMAANEVDAWPEDGDLLGHLTQLAEQARRLVPDLVGVSVAPLNDGITFTLVATARDVAVLDAVQYLAGGPCVDAAHSESVTEFDHGILDELRWRLFAEATAARGVRSTLTLPLLSDGRVRGTVNLYAAAERAFVGFRDQLAEVFGAWAEGAVANADLSFATRAEAEAAPRRLRDQQVIETATGIMAARLGVDVEAAIAAIQDAAYRAGVSLLQVAREILNARQGQDGT
jgi:GAF domain-containing protein